VARIKPTRFEFQPVQLVRPCEIVAYRITEAISAGDVRVGERLPSEKDLSDQLGVSRPTLREAIKLLVQAGVVEVIPGSSGGIFVISEQIPSDLSGLPLEDISLEELEHTLEARRLFEPHIARLAAMYATPSDFERMRSAVRLSADTVAQFRGRKISATGVQLMTLASTRFNIAVARATQNPMLLKMTESMLRRIELVRQIALRELPDISVSTKTLASSLAAIESGDPEQIDHVTADRIAELESAWERATGKRLRRRALTQVITASKSVGLATPQATKTSRGKK
jgi:GntR family transcriptional repressor for pyruvate dehydrogenase complex